jgi:hypothetical protein
VWDDYFDLSRFEFSFLAGITYVFKRHHGISFRFSHSILPIGTPEYEVTSGILKKTLQFRILSDVFFSVLNKLRLSETLLWRFVLATPHCGCRLVWGYLHCVRVVPPGQQ